MEPLRTIIGYTRGMRGLFFVVSITSVIEALANLVTPVIIKIATDWILRIITHVATFDWSMIWWLVAGLLAVALVSMLAQDIGSYYGDQLAIRTRYQLSTRYFKHLLSLPQSYYDNEVTGKIINRLNRAITEITNFIQFFSNGLLQMLLTTLVTLVILFYYSWPVALLFILLIPMNLYLTVRTSGPWQKLEDEKNKHFDIASGRFAEVVGQIRLVKSFGSQKYEYNYFDRHMKQMVPLTARQSRHWHLMNAMRSGVFGIVNTAIFGFIFYQTARGNLSLGDMAMIIVLVQQASSPLRSLSFFVNNIQRAVANSRDYIAALAEKPEPENVHGQQLKVHEGRVVFRDINFAYDRGKKVLHDIAFQIEPGQKVALVGESGGGKSTIANLLMGLYRPESGEVLIDKQNILDASLMSVRAQIAVVFQDAALFSGTIRENIAYAKPDASVKEIESAARAANAHGFIMKFEKGYDTEIGERGIKLSGGQKQRISIARAILKDAPILVLDEATSALDSRAEQEVQGALDHLMRQRTTLIIAHRLSTIAGVDRIITLRDGHIDEIGSPGELAGSGGIYAQLLELQMGASEKAKRQLAKYDIAA